MTQEPQADDVRDEAAGPASAGPAGPQPDSSADEREPEQPKIVVTDRRKINLNGTPVPEPEVIEVTEDEEIEADEVETATIDTELTVLRNDLGELTRDLQRVTAEYANYRKRVDRDRTLVAEQATGSVLTQLLPVLDDLDRARAHGDLVGPFAAVADQLAAALGKFGMTAFGDVGDPFDPTVHEAVSHTSSAEVTETTCVDIMRRGYLLGERLLRPALVAVADPE